MLISMPDLFGFTIESSPLIQSPKGGEKWKAGKTYLIKWEGGNNNNVGAVNIVLLKSGKKYLTIKKGAPHTGLYRWKIPKSVASGTKYKVKISNSSGSSTSKKFFTITGGGASSSPSGSLQVTSPNGKEKWTAGTTKIIKWKKAQELIESEGWSLKE